MVYVYLGTSLLFKAEQRMTDDEKECLQEIMAVDKKVGNLRGFLSGIWHIFLNHANFWFIRLFFSRMKHLLTTTHF